MRPSSGTPYICQPDSFLAEVGHTFKGRRVLVTGATGFIGWHLCKALIALEADVHGLSRTASTKNIPRGCQPVPIDLRDYESVKVTLFHLKPDLIYHLAAMVTTQQDMVLTLPMLQHNVIGTVHLLPAAAEAKCDRFVCVGSSEEISVNKPEKAPSSPYTAAKITAGLYVRMFYQLYNLPAVYVRPFLVYGPRQRAAKLIPYTIVSLLKGESPQLGSGHRVCDFVYVLDVVRGLLKAGIEPRVVGETVDLGTGYGIRIRDAVNLLVELTGSKTKPVFGAMPDRVGEDPQVADSDKAKRLLGWESIWSLRDGLADTVAWYRAKMERETH